ncbi:MAG: ATP-binding protein [Chitinispirillales bacterium]|jgi:anti-sigma regulatory factor (Ser/Thr protein kinase)|nr:ATP-binding protein [Chitinispirillales bacterium]
MDELTIDARVGNLNMVIRFISERLEAAGCTMKQQAQMTIAAEEVFVNISRYAYGQMGGGATVRVTVGDEIVVEFEDCGKPYNPIDKKDPDITADADKREIGGLGVFMVKKLMDSVEYRRVGEKNVLTLRKKVAPVLATA